MSSSERSLTSVALQSLKQAMLREVRYEYNWFQYFRMKNDPTESEPVNSDFDANLVDRQQEARTIGLILGSAAKGSSAIILLLGPVGSGRTSLVNFLLHLNEQASQEKIRCHKVSLRELTMYKPDRIADYFEKNMAKDTKLLILDDVEELGDKLLEALTTQVPRAVLKLVVTTPAHFLALRHRDELVSRWRMALVSPLTERDSLAFLKNIMTRALQRSSDYSSLFESDAVPRMICEYGMGIPGLTLNLLRQCFLLAYQKDSPRLDKTTVLEVARRGAYEVALKQIIEHKLTEKLFEVLFTLYFMTSFVPGAQGAEGGTANQLEEQLDMDRTTVAHYLSELYEMGVVTKQKRGKPVYYKVPEPVQAALELDCVKRIR